MMAEALIDWPMSREEKKKQLLRLYSKDVRVADVSREESLKALRAELESVRAASGMVLAPQRGGAIDRGDRTPRTDELQAEVLRLTLAVESVAAVLRAILPGDEEADGESGQEQHRRRARSEGTGRKMLEATSSPALKPALSRTPRSSRCTTPRRVSFGDKPELLSDFDTELKCDHECADQIGGADDAADMAPEADLASSIRIGGEALQDKSHEGLAKAFVVSKGVVDDSRNSTSEAIHRQGQRVDGNAGGADNGARITVEPYPSDGFQTGGAAIADVCHATKTQSLVVNEAAMEERGSDGGGHTEGEVTEGWSPAVEARSTDDIKGYADVSAKIASEADPGRGDLVGCEAVKEWFGAFESHGGAESKCLADDSAIAEPEPEQPTETATPRQPTRKPPREILPELCACADVDKIGMGFKNLPPDDMTVWKVHKDSWAAKQGVQRGDDLIAVNGKRVVLLNGDQFIEMMKARPLRLFLEREPQLGDERFQS